MRNFRLNRILPGAAAALAVFANAGAADTAVPAGITGLVPEAGDYRLLYSYDLKSGTDARDRSRVNYLVDNSGDLSKNAVEKVAYFVELTGNDGGKKWVFVSMDAFDPNAIRLGVPTRASGSLFQQKVNNLEVRSNVEGVKTGSFADGNIEFWPRNYGAKNAKEIPGASDSKFDFGDSISATGDHGSMQVHNYREGQTVFAYSNFNAGSNSAFGIGNNPAPDGNPDWTFSKSGPNYSKATLHVLVRSGAPLEKPLAVAPPKTAEQFRADAAALVPETKNMKLLYVHNLRGGAPQSGVSYLFDGTGEVAGKAVTRVGYLARLTNGDGSVSWVYAEMDAFSPDAKKLGVPVKAADAVFQQKVTKLDVRSNTDRVKTGSFADGGIEFWPYNYDQRNSAAVANADDKKYDWGDHFDEKKVGYGSMQIHNPGEQQTVFAYNNFGAGENSDVGIGSNPAPEGHPDWTFSKSGSALKDGTLYVFAVTE